MLVIDTDNEDNRRNKYSLDEPVKKINTFLFRLHKTTTCYIISNIKYDCLEKAVFVKFVAF